MPMGEFDERKALRVVALRASVERGNRARDGVAPPDVRSWRYRTGGFPRVLAIAGVVVGFLLLIVPGLFALRSYRRWRDGEHAEAALAWSLAVLPVAIVPAAVLFPVAPILAVVVFFLLGVPLFVLVGPRT
jgi:hypothetical protein